MEKKRLHNKKELKESLAYLMMFYLDGLSGKKKEKLKSYMIARIDNIVDHYANLLKKEEWKNISSLPLSTELATDHYSSHKNGKHGNDNAVGIDHQSQQR